MDGKRKIDGRELNKGKALVARTASPVVLYTTDDGQVTVQVIFANETFWLTQKTVADLFDVTVPAISKHLKLTVDTTGLEGEANKVLADHGRVVQILTNLISNAIKATPKNGEIHVSAKAGTGRHKGSIVITVSDNGIGISPENQKKIFERFEQIKTNGRSRDGVGLGLTIVRHLITSHHGSLWLESEENKGAAFHFSLPYAPNNG